MIKGNLFGKSLKQFFIILLISCFILLGSSFVSAGFTRELGNYGFNPYNQSYDVKVSITGTPYTELGGVEKKMFVLYNYDFGYAGLYNNYFWWWGSRGIPYIFMHDGGIGIDSQGYINKYSICDEIISYSNESKPGNCSELFVSDNTPNSFRVFFASLTSSDYYFADFYRENPTMSMTFCISNHLIGNSLCFDSSSLTGNLNIQYSYGFNDISDSYLFNAPSVINGGGGSSDLGNEIDKTIRTISYFESQGFRREMCFVGTNDLTTLYGSGTDSFQVGTGKTIFDLFESEYVYIEDTDYGYQAVANWLNSRLTNYYQWFNFGELSSIKANYSSVDELISIYYYGQDERATFPFLNNPFAIYFMASNISDYVQMKSIADFEGEDVVDYCNLKVNGGTFEDLISPSTENAINRITANVNNIGGVQFGTGGLYLSGFFGGTGENAYTGTWQELQFSGNINLKSFFDNAVESMQSASSNMQNPFTGVLPNYIIFGFLLFALFKLLRR